jgi:hypothetical protein
LKSQGLWFQSQLLRSGHTRSILDFRSQKRWRRRPLWATSNSDRRRCSRGILDAYPRATRKERAENDLIWPNAQRFRRDGLRNWSSSSSRFCFRALVNALAAVWAYFGKTIQIPTISTHSGQRRITFSKWRTKSSCLNRSLVSKILFAQDIFIIVYCAAGIPSANPEGLWSFWMSLICSDSAGSTFAAHPAHSP